MRSYFNGAGTPSSSSATPPPSLSSGGGGGARRSSSYMPSGSGGRSSSASLPRSPDNDLHQAMSAHSSVVGSSGVGGAPGSSSSHDVYVNIYQNTNHPSLFVSVLKSLHFCLLALVKLICLCKTLGTLWQGLASLPNLINLTFPVLALCWFTSHC